MVLQNNNNDNNDRRNNGANDENENLNFNNPPRNEHRPGIAVVPVGEGVVNNNRNHNPNRNLIQDLDGWLESNGLRSVDDVLQDDTTSENIQEEELRRIEEEEQYAKSIHRKAFYKDIIKEKKERENKKQVMQTLFDKSMDIRTSNNEIICNIPLHHMANVCETIYTMVQNKSLWDHHHHNHHHRIDETNSSRPIKHAAPTTSFLQLSLETYSKSAVQEFVNLCLAYDSDEDDLMCSTTTTTGSTSDENTDTKNRNNKTYRTDVKSTCRSSRSGTTGAQPLKKASSIIHVLHQIPDDAIVLDCCRIGHYLMAQPIVDTIIHDVLIPNIDTHNCFTLYTLADELNLTSSTLLQRTLSHMIQTIGEYSAPEEDTNDNDEWNHNDDAYHQELNERLRTMKRALESSVHGHSGNSHGPQRLYFSSIEEYLSIFAERVQYYRERLHEAKECQRQQQQQQISSSSSFTIRGRVISSSYTDAEKKIQKQEQRVRTLEIAYAEQKALFRKSSSSGSK